MRADVGRLTGTPLATLDDSPAVLTAIEDALVALIAKRVSRDELRLVRSRVVLFLGDLVRRRIGGEWTVSEEARGELGEFEASGWAPARLVNNVSSENRGIFERILPGVYQRGQTS